MNTTFARAFYFLNCIGVHDGSAGGRGVAGSVRVHGQPSRNSKGDKHVPAQQSDGCGYARPQQSEEEAAGALVWARRLLAHVSLDTCVVFSKHNAGAPVRQAACSCSKFKFSKFFCPVSPRHRNPRHCRHKLGYTCRIKMSLEIAVGTDWKSLTRLWHEALDMDPTFRSRENATTSVNILDLIHTTQKYYFSWLHMSLKKKKLSFWYAHKIWMIALKKICRCYPSDLASIFTIWKNIRSKCSRSFLVESIDVLS